MENPQTDQKVEKNLDDQKEQDKSKPKIKTVTIKEQGAKLPLGLVDASGNYMKDLVTRPWRFKEEKLLSKLREENSDLNIAEYIGIVISNMCKKLSIHDFPEIAADAGQVAERRVQLGQMCMGDIWYAYVWLRIKSIGKEFAVGLSCPFCGAKFTYQADLETTEVHIAESIEDAQWIYTLNDPFMIRGKEAKELLIGPMRWTTLEMLGDSISDYTQGAAKAGAIIGSVVGIVGHNEVISLTEDELDEMTKLDLENLSGQIDEKSLGPSMMIEGQCEKRRCKKKFRIPIDWRYDNFFGASSP